MTSGSERIESLCLVEAAEAADAKTCQSHRCLPPAVSAPFTDRASAPGFFTYASMSAPSAVVLHFISEVTDEVRRGPHSRAHCWKTSRKLSKSKSFTGLPNTSRALPVGLFVADEVYENVYHPHQTKPASTPAKLGHRAAPDRIGGAIWQDRPGQLSNLSACLAAAGGRIFGDARNGEALFVSCLNAIDAVRRGE